MRADVFSTRCWRLNFFETKGKSWRSTAWICRPSWPDWDSQYPVHKKEKKKIGARQTAFPYFYIPSLYIPPNHFFVMVLSCTPDYAFNFLPSFDGRQVSIILLVGKCCILYIITILQHFQIKAYLHSNSYYGQTKHKHQWK